MTSTVASLRGIYMDKEKITTKELSEAFKGITDSILSSVDKETGDAYPELIERIKDYDDAKDFDLLFMYPLRNSVDMGILKKYPYASRENIDHISFIYCNYHFIESHIKRLVQNREGSACCVDKSRYVANALVEYYGNERPLNLPYDEKTDKENRVYWKPHFWDDAQWIQLFESLVAFWFGRPEKYLLFMRDNLSNSKVEE